MIVEILIVLFVLYLIDPIAIIDMELAILYWMINKTQEWKKYLENKLAEIENDDRKEK